MVSEFTHIEIRIINNLMAKSPVEYIAMIIDKPEQQVEAKVKELSVLAGRLPFIMKQHNKVLRESLTKINKRTLNQVRTSERLPKKDVKPKFENLSVDYSKKILVRIDRKTFISINAGENIEEAKAKFFQSHKSYSQSPAENPWKPFKKSTR